MEHRPQPIRDGHWVDGDGIRWDLRGRRGAQPDQVVLRRVLKRPGLRVLHAYGPDPAEVNGPDRETLLDRVRAFWAGAAPAHSEFWLAESRDDAGGTMLIIVQAC